MCYRFLYQSVFEYLLSEKYNSTFYVGTYLISEVQYSIVNPKDEASLILLKKGRNYWLRST